MSPVITLRALDYYNGSQPTVDSAVELARAAGQLLKAGESVVISFAGLRAVSSSYFNALLVWLRESYNLEFIRERVRFETESNSQRMIFDRSYQAVIGAAA